MSRTLIVCLIAATSAACSSKTSEPASQTTETRAAAAKPAAPAVKPGTYEDWCDEHQVPESQCTRCNADLIPAFKATNDWCAEHGVPESQCLKCNPGLMIVRPTKTAKP